MPAQLTRADVNAATIQQAADDLAIQSPIRSWDVRDGQLLLYIATGDVTRWTPPEFADDPVGATQAGDPATKKPEPSPSDLRSAPASPASPGQPTPTDAYETLLKRELITFARQRGIDVLSRWRKRHLIAALREWDRRQSLLQTEEE